MSQIHQALRRGLLFLTRRELLKLGGLGSAALVVGCVDNPIAQDPDAAANSVTDLDAATLADRDPGDAGHSDWDQGRADQGVDDVPEQDARSEDAASTDAGQAATRPAPIVLLQLSDLHVGAQAFAAAALQRASQDLWPLVQPHLTLLTGDLVDQGDDDGQWDRYADLISAAGWGTAQIVEQPGNHDAKSDPDLNRYLGRTATGQANGALFGFRDLLVDGRRLRLVSINTASGGSYTRNLTGYLQDAQVDALLSMLAADSHQPDATLILGHHPKDGSNGLALLQTDDQLQRLIDATGAQAYIFGHVHRPELTWSGDCLQVQAPTLGNPGLLSSEPGFSLLTFDAGLAVQHFTIIKNDDDSASLDWPLVQITDPIDATLGQSNPRAQTISAGSMQELRAVVFSPNPPDEVAYAINAGDWTPMTMGDGFYFAAWQAGAPGTCQLTVRVRAEGHTRSHEISVRVN